MLLIRFMRFTILDQTFAFDLALCTDHKIKYNLTNSDTFKIIIYNKTKSSL